ncbi:cytochrome c [Polaribacter vadi]|uniref:c-type cytochrome n=1 Tax=Polaribacter TaxID=52959 RepID=UPI001C07F055|nr:MULTISPECIES: cytochrome c [Polaribacter]MBU3011246.1 cytochrome c [Polaribacter vadi]MDO6741059.1 cytochrome c [Polaribacter sp. 1_MG-2023]
MKNFKLFIALIVFASIISCNNKRKPQLEYMPDMYESVAYDANGAEGINNKPVNSKPVAGTIPRGGHPAYDIPDTAEGYDKAKAELKNPLEASEENLEKGKALYEIYCISCHGKKGDGNGYLSQAEKFEGIPSYNDRDINAGSIYHVIMYGKNLMGSHSSQLTYNERWQIIHYVENLRAEL